MKSPRALFLFFLILSTYGARGALAVHVEVELNDTPHVRGPGAGRRRR